MSFDMDSPRNIRCAATLLLAAGLSSGTAYAEQPVPSTSPTTSATRPATRPLMLEPARLEAAADAVARDYVPTGTSPGFSVAVASHGQVVFQKSYGKADVEMNVDATPQTIYRIGSLANQFTAPAVMRLLEQGKLSLDDPITKHLPDFPTQGHDVRLRHLLNHTSGIKNYTGIGTAPARPRLPPRHDLRGDGRARR